MSLPQGYTLRGFEPDDLPVLWDVESAATRQLAAAGYPELLKQSADPLAFEAQFAGKGVWIAADENNQAVGYAIAGELADLFWLHQMSVVPSHGRKGIGTALLMAVINHAKWAFHSAIGLTTFRDVAFNAPFYEKAGFMRVNPASLSQSLQAQLAKECAPGIEVSSRVVMVRRL
ncbi:MAG: GNAT family N-acetyltransferase [Ahrensia sp.]